jgi:hypothetical protein
MSPCSRKQAAFAASKITCALAEDTIVHSRDPQEGKRHFLSGWSKFGGREAALD